MLTSGTIEDAAVVAARRVRLRIAGLLLVGFFIPSALLAQNWNQQSPATSPPARDGAAMVYDPVHHQTVLFGGEASNGTPLADTWVYDGTNWTQLHPATSPPARLWHGMAFDPSHGNIVLFGGCPNDSCDPAYLADTWLWNGTTWAQQFPAQSPAARLSPAMAYSPQASNSSGGVLLLGGSSVAEVPLGDMWYWDGTNWNSLGAQAPPARICASMSYDPINNQTVVFGGDNGTVLLNDTWLWNGVSWTNPTPANPPEGRSTQGQVYDPVRQLTVVFGGGALNDTWLWNGKTQTWAQETTIASPTGGRFYITLAYDIQHDTTVLFGGQGSSGIGDDLNDTWTLGYVYTSGWMKLSSSTGGAPPPRYLMSAASDGNTVYLFGGLDGNNINQNDTWFWSGDEYAVLSGGTPPSIRNSAAMVYSPQDHGILLFGGANASVNPLGDTWVYGGGGWVQQAPATVPPARSAQTMVYDQVNKDVVMFGGAGLNDTWIWAGGNWIQVHPANSPPARNYASMVYDAARSQTLLFGGTGTAPNSLMNDTWVWDGINWTQLHPATVPPVRYGAQMIYDSVHGTVLLFGGEGVASPMADLWQWDGVNWTLVTTQFITAPAGRYGAAATFNASTQQFFMFGGSEVQIGVGGETWMYASPYLNALLPTAFYQQPGYDAPLNAVGGVAPYTYTPTGVPQTFAATGGLSLNSSTGVVSGTDDLIPGQPPLGIGITLADAQGQSTVIPLTLITDNPIVFAPSPPPDATAGTLYSYVLSASGGTPPFQYVIDSSATWLTGGFGINTVSGMCPASTTSSYSFFAEDSLNGVAIAGPFTINCNPAPQITNPAALAGGTVGLNYSVQLTTNAVYDAPGAAPYTWSVPPNTLPPGLNLGSTTGQITGFPTASGTTMFTVTFTDRWGASTNKQLSITVILPLTISTTQFAIGNMGIAYPAGQAVVGNGGVPPYAFQAASFPPGLSLNANTGAITGTPTTVGNYNTLFTVTDSASNLVQTTIKMFVVTAGTDPVDWVQLSPVSPPSVRVSPSVFYDSDTQTTILFGGIGPGGALGDTDTWNGVNWTPLSPASSPGARASAAVAYDPVHHQGVLFGGLNGSFAAIADTWLWNGTTWTPATPTNIPPARYDAMMVWDGQQIVLFGGTAGDGGLNDTWIWNGANWTPVSIANPPGTRQGAGIAFDSGNNNVVMFGGYDFASSTQYRDTWIWAPAAMTWTLESPANPPPGRYDGKMVYDSLHSVSVLFGGISTFSESDLADTWEWNGATWSQVSPPYNPGQRDDFAMVYDPVHFQTVLFGGENPSGADFANDTWVFGGPVPLGTSLPAGSVGTLYSDSVTIQGGINPLLLVAGALPPGMSFTPATQTFGGTPTAVGNYMIPVTVQDAQGIAIVPQYSINITSGLSLQPNSLPNATAGANYLEQLSASGGLPAYAFSATGLPAGLHINGSNQIVGQCTASSNNVMLKVTDSASDIATVGPLTVTCNAAPAITSTSPLADGTVNVPYTAAIQMTGGTAPITWSLTPGTLPAGFQLSNAGVLTGTGTSPVSAQFSVTITDFWGAQAVLPFTLNIESLLTITSTTLLVSVQGVAYPNTPLAVNGGTGVGTYTFSASGLPAGMHINPSTGVISGMPGQAGIFQPTFTVTDQTPQTVMQQIALEIISNTGNPNWTNLNPASPPGARDSAAMAYDPVHAVTVLFGGNPGFTDTWTFGFPATWTKQTPPNAPPSAGLAPSMAWMSSQNDIVLFGGQTATATVNETWVWDGATWTQKAPAANPPARYYAGMAPDSLHHQIVLFGGSSGGGFANALQDTWVWDGANWTKKTPATVPTAAFAPSLSDGPTGPVLFGGLDSSGNPLNQTWVWDGNNWNLQHPLISPPARTQAGMVYNSQFGATVLFGGSSGGVNLQDTWQWNGNEWNELSTAAVPPARDNINLSYDSVDNQVIVFGGGSVPDLGDTWTLGFAVVTNTALPPVTAGAPYNATIPVIGGTPPYSFAPTGVPQSLPNGLNINLVTGQITGSTQAVGTYSLGIAIGDSQTGSASTSFTLSLTVSPAGSLLLAPQTLPDATASTNYHVQLSASGGVPPYLFSATGLPAGLQINVNNQIAGQCTAGSNNVTLTVTDSAAPVPNVNSVLNLAVHCNALPSITSASPLPSGIVGTPYSATIQLSGGTAPITWMLNPGNLPAGFQLSNTGTLTGTATAPATPQFNTSVTDLWGASTNKAFTLTFYPVLTIGTNSLPNGTAGAAYQNGVSIAPSGGTGNGTYAFSAVGLPNGYSIDPATGAISGSTVQSGLFTPTFTVTDQDTQIASKQINLTIVSGSGITFLSPPTLPTGTSGQLYSYSLLWSGGVPPFTVTSTNALPVWLTLNAGTGKLTGTPPAGGAFTFPVTITDSQDPVANKATQIETIVVNPPSITSQSPLPAAYIGIAYTQNLTANGGAPAYTWSSANLPAWLNLSPAGALTGTPPANTPASVIFNVTVTDSLGAFVSGSLTLPVLATPGLLFQTTSPLPPGTPTVPYTAAIQASGGNGVLTLSASGLPNWLSFHAANGTVTGTPPSAGPVTFQLTLTDTVNQSLSQYFTLPVNAALAFATASTLPPASVGLLYSETLAASGGSGSYTWSCSNLPQWLSLSPAGVLSGTPPQAAALSLRITVKDTQNNSLSQTFTLQALAALTIDTATPLPAATLNFPYMATFTASGGAGNYQWSAAGLPAGFTLSPAGVLSGAPQAGAAIVFSVTVTDSLDNSALKNVTLPVSSSLTLNAPSPPAATQLLPYNANLTASGGNPGYSWSAAGLPAWLSLSQAGYLSGTPPNSGPVTFQATITDAQQNSFTGPITVTVSPSLAITTAALPGAGVNLAYSTALAAAGGVGAYTWSAAGLPNGLAISPAGTLSGSVSQSGSYPLQITVWDSETSIASKSLTLLVAPAVPLSFVTQSLNPCIANTACSNQIVAAGGIPPYTFSVAPNANLDGLTLSANGLLSGTPAAGGAVSVPVILTDQQSSINRTFNLTVTPSLVVTTASFPSGTVGSIYGFQLSASGGQPPYTWSVVPGSGAIPPGLNFDAPSGDISGKPTTAGAYTFSVQVTDGHQTSPARQFSISIAPVAAPLTVTSAVQLPPGIVGTAYTQTLMASGGSGAYTWTVTAGALPAGLSLGAAGTITGTPTTAQTANFTATVRDTSGNSVASAFSIVVTSPNTVSLLTPNPLPNGIVGVVYTYALQVTGGTPPYFYSIIAGQLPPGLTFDQASGELSGTPTVKGNFPLVMTVTDSGGQVANAAAAKAAGLSPRASVTTNYIIQVSGPGDFQITTQPNLPNGTLNQIYSTTLTASGGAAPYQWQLENGTLPAGLALSPGGAITGSPTQAGLTSLVIKVTDTTGATATGAFLLQIVNPNVPAIDAFPPLPPGTVGTVYRAAITAVGGHAPYIWSISGGVLPAGLSLNQFGGLNGTPTQAGSFTFTTQIIDSAQVTALQALTIRVNSLDLKISPASVPNAIANVAYSFALSVAGGTAPYTWSLSAGGLLGGFTINPSTGAIGGTATVPGVYQFSISVVDSNFGLASQNYQLTVQSESLSISTASVSAATVGVSYDFGLQAANSTPPLAWTVVSGALPPGIQITNSSGLLVGTPSAAGSYPFTVQVTDATTATAQAAFTLVVNPQPLTIVTATLPGGTIATAYSQTVKSAGGTGAISWSVSAGTLPTGLTLGAATGTISGTPTAPGPFNFTVKATDSTGVTAQEPYSVTIAGPPALPAITLSGLPATSQPGAQPVVTITLASAYPLPIQVTATLTITPNLANSTDLMFGNGTRTTQITIPANTTTATIAFQVGTLPGAIQFSLSLAAAGVNITPTVQPSATTTIAATAPVIESVTVTTTATGLQVTVVGTSTTLSMNTAAFQFTPAAGATLQTSSVSVNVSSLFAAWYASAASLPTGSQFSLVLPFTVTGNISSIASVSVTLTNSVGASNVVSANVP